MISLPPVTAMLVYPLQSPHAMAQKGPRRHLQASVQIFLRQVSLTFVGSFRVKCPCP